MNTNTLIQNVLNSSTCLHDHEAIEKAFDQMAEKINAHPLSKECPIFLGIAIGGFLPLSSLTLRLKFPLLIDFAHISSYYDKTFATELLWKAKPHLPLKDKTVVIVDDILDKGLTLAALIDFCKNEGAKSIYTAVLIDKKVERTKGGLEKADFVGLEIEDKFVFGYGLDYKGYLRNAPGIYELAEEYKK